MHPGAEKMGVEESGACCREGEAAGQGMGCTCSAAIVAVHVCVNLKK